MGNAFVPYRSLETENGPFYDKWKQARVRGTLLWHSRYEGYYANLQHAAFLFISAFITFCMIRGGASNIGVGAFTFVTSVLGISLARNIHTNFLQQNLAVDYMQLDTRFMRKHFELVQQNNHLTDRDNRMRFLAHEGGNLTRFDMRYSECHPRQYENTINTEEINFDVEYRSWDR